MAEPGLEKSTVVNVADGKSIPSSVCVLCISLFATIFDAYVCSHFVLAGVLRDGL
jgi:hypothetical protein